MSGRQRASAKGQRPADATSSSRHFLLLWGCLLSRTLLKDQHEHKAVCLCSLSGFGTFPRPDIDQKATTDRCVIPRPSDLQRTPKGCTVLCRGKPRARLSILRSALGCDLCLPVAMTAIHAGTDVRGRTCPGRQ